VSLFEAREMKDEREREREREDEKESYQRT
jgi:hypothetical protein